MERQRAETPTSSGFGMAEDICAMIDLCVYLLEKERPGQEATGMKRGQGEAEMKKSSMPNNKEAVLRKIIDEAQKTVEKCRWVLKTL